ncbi:non-ribosomal peptide synthetase [Catenuloplanes niger]|nr:non-ribosomal peptide synthetase [Catenuloplanes niger]
MVHARPSENASHERYEAVTLQPGMLFGRHRRHSGVDLLQVVVDWPVLLDPAAMRTAWRHAAARHPVLRTGFDWPLGDPPTQAVRPSAEVPVELHDWTGTPDRDLAAFLAADRGTGFDHAHPPLVRVTLITHRPGRHTVAITLHHAILDGRSVRHLLAEVFTEHDALAAGRAFTAPDRPAYRDFALWVASRPENGDRPFWRAHLAGATLPTPLPVLAPADGAPDRTPGSVRETALELTAAQTDALRATGVPMDTLVTAAWAATLRQHTDGDDVVFGSVRSCRRDTVDGADRMIGLLINTLPLRVPVAAGRPVRDWLAETGRRVTGLHDHRLTPLDRIQRWSGVPADRPLFDTLLMYDHRNLQSSLAATVPGWGGRRARVHRHPGPPVTLCVFGEPGVHALLYHDRHRLAPAAADALLHLFGAILTALPAHLDGYVRDLPGAGRLADPPAPARPACESPDTDNHDAPGTARAADPPGDAGGRGRAVLFGPDRPAALAGRTVVDLVVARVEARPDAVAVVAPDATLTYRELLERADRVAGGLLDAGVRPDTPVAVALPRSAALIVALLGVLRAGAGYLPLDPADPPDRTAAILDQAGDPITITAESIPDAAPRTRAAHPAGLAYVCHTSGSTGVPKAVGVPHAAVVRLVHEPGYLRLGPGERVLHLAPVAFDAATLEIWGSLASGATLVAAPPGPLGAAEVADVVRRERISVLWLTAGLFHQVVELAPDGLAGVGQLLAGGDVLDPAAVRRALRARNGQPLINGYGPTENTTFTTVHVLTGADEVPEPVPIGRPVPGTAVYLLDAALRPVPAGTPGDLYTGGTGLARGYLGRPAATARVFLPDPFRGVPGARMYRTGDRARLRADGTLEFLGRADDQVKIRGFRVEPGEAAAVLRRHPAVTDAAVVADGTGERRRLIGYYCVRDGVPVDDLAGFLSRHLPAYLRPAALVPLPALPLTPAGKLDRRALPAPPASASGAAPRGDVETRLAAIWCELLGVPAAGRDDDFFARGGNSLLATRLTFAVADAFHVDLPVRTVFDTPALRDIAAAIAARPPSDVDGPVARDRSAYRLTPPGAAPSAAPGSPVRDRSVPAGEAGPVAPDTATGNRDDAGPAAPGVAEGAAIRGAASGVGAHLVRPGGDWALWRWVGLRAAGFPIDTLTALGDPALGDAADALDDAGQRCDDARRALGHLLHLARAAAPPGERGPWNRAARHARRDTAPAPLPPRVSAAHSTPHDATASLTRKPAAPETREPAAPGVREPVAPGAREPAAPGARKSVAPGVREPVAPETPEPAAPEARQSAAPEASEPAPHRVSEVEYDALVAAHTAAVAAHAAHEEARERFAVAYERASAHRTDGLRRAAADPRFREAVAWQNRAALHTGVADVARPGGAGSQYRQHQALVATYLQRYCGKNDTIGFFGPVGWAEVTDAGPALGLRPAGLAARTVYFENWAVSALADRLAGDDRLQPWLVPRRMPFLRVDGDALLLPLTPPAPLDPDTARLLRAADGTRTAGEIAAALGADPDDVFRRLAGLRDARRISWSFEVPKEDVFPERALRARLAAVGDPAARARALAALDRLEAARDAVAAAAGDPDRLDAAITGLERTFTDLTGTAATRRAGKAYAGRTVVYEDCRSGTGVTLSTELVGTLWPSLSLLLASARWFTFAGAALFHRACADRYRELAARSGSPDVPFADFWLWAGDVLFDAPERLTGPVVRGLRERWSRILPAADRGRITADSAALADEVRRRFAAPRPGWSGAHQHSPDVMLAADGPDAIGRGDFHWVVGEVHPGVNTLRSALFVAQHPDPDRLRAAMLADLPRRRIVLAATGEEGGAPARITDGLVTGRDLRIVFGHDSGGLDPATALPVADCVLRDDGGVLTVASRDGRHRMPLAEVIGEPVMLQLLQRFDVLPPADHRPRVTVDRVVWSRESWTFPAAGLDFAHVADEADRFRRARAWQRAHRLPRHVFVVSPAEKKPFHLDLASLASVDVFARAVRRAGPDARLKLSEMLPGPDQTWLTGTDGRRHTAELRLVAVDTRRDHP